jgi:hypothetical protein
MTQYLPKELNGLTFKKLARGKHGSLLCGSIINEEKQSFIVLTPGNKGRDTGSSTRPSWDLPA